MTFLKTTLAALVVISSAGYAQAQDSREDTGTYGGLSLGAFVTNPDGARDAELYTAEVKIGYNFNKYFGVEAQGLIGLNSDEFILGPTTIDREVDYSVSAFAVARLPVTESFQIFARGGLHSTQISVDSTNSVTNGVIREGTIRRSSTETGLAVGAGAQYDFDKKNALRADYTYLDGTNGETLSLGYIRKF